jgi:hypothetical protein
VNLYIAFPVEPEDDRLPSLATRIPKEYCTRSALDLCFSAFQRAFLLTKSLLGAIKKIRSGPDQANPEDTLKTVKKKLSARTGVDLAEPYELVSSKHGPMLVNRHDFYMGQAFLKYGECLEIELQFLRAMLQFPGLVIEIGSNMGALTIPLAAELARQGREMLVFEPQAVIF